MRVRELIESDVHRYLGTAGSHMRPRLSERPQLSYLRNLRRAQGSPSRLARLLARLRLHRLAARTHIQIPWCCSIGPGFYIGHMGRVVIHPDAVIGANCNVATGVTIGAISSGRRQGVPVIGDRVWIGTNAVVVGGVRIGTDVAIAPGAYVNFDVPDHSVVIGNPGVIHHKERATAGLLQNLVDVGDVRDVGDV